MPCIQKMEKSKIASLLLPMSANREKEIELKFNTFFNLKRKYKYEVNKVKRQELVNALFKLQLYSEIMLDETDLSESEKEMLTTIYKRNVTPMC